MRRESNPADDPVNICNLYRTFCAEEGCHVNSAVLQYIESCGAMFPLEKLVLSKNYLGPRGLRPIIRLVEYCQTLTQLSLEGNGADNETVERLCAVLKNHMSMESLKLRGNPITMTGGKHVLLLVERNPRIIDVDLSDTDVFDALIYKINKVVAANRQRILQGTPRLVKSDADEERILCVRSSSSAVRLATQKPVLSTLPGIKRDAVGEKLSQYSNGAPALTRPQPCPPIPAIVSKDCARLPEARRQELHKRLKEKALLLREISGSNASRAADRAREKLMLMERSTKSPILCKKWELATAACGRQSSHTAQLPAYDVSEMMSVDGDADTHALPAHVLQVEERRAHSRSVSEQTVSGLNFVNEVPKGDKSADNGEVFKTDVVESVDVNKLAVVFSEPNEVEQAGSGSAITDAAAEAYYGDEEDTPLVVLLESSEWMTLDSCTQFQRLFDYGCRAYIKHDFDAAYMAWNEAMGIAAKKKNREWMAVISSNLQRLSYEMLVREGVAKLESDQLEEADEVFQRALEVAQRARNARWEADMHKARKDVQNAVFQRCHESALKFFQRARLMQDQALTDDDYFVVPGTDVMMRHTEAFVNEWKRMLLVKEAVEIWASTRRVIERIGGNAGCRLQRIVSEAFDSVAHFLAARCFDAHETLSLSWMHTSLYSYHECIMLCTLWTDMSSCDKFTEHHKLFAAVAAAQIGNYYLATYQLDHAQTQFDTLETLAEGLEDPFLRAAGHTFSALVNWQRARYSVAESLLRVAVFEWGTLRDAMVAAAHAGKKDGGAGNDERGGDVCLSKLLAFVPSEHIAVMEAASFRYLVSSIASMYRYGEALEVLERSLICKYRDLLFDKMENNFSLQPTLENIVATSLQVHSPFIYQLVTHTYEWCVEDKRYVVNEKLLMWVVPQGSAMRFVEVGVTKDFKVSSIHDLVDVLRRELRVDPLSTSGGVEENIILKLPERAWMQPLQTLYAIFVDPVIEFLRALDPLFLSKNGVVTIIPTERLWLVPFNALVAQNGNFLVEDFAVQMAFCATQCAFSAMNTKRVQQRDLHRDVVVVQRDVDAPSAHLLSHVVFPFDPLRSTNEGESIMRTMAQQKLIVRFSRRSTNTAAVTTSSEMLVDDLDTLLEVLPKSRTAYIATATTTAVCDDENSAGAICMAVSQNEISLLRSTEIARMNLFAELVVMSNTNMSASRVIGTRDDVLGLVRAFFASGVPCVIAGQWCTPDMVPAELFSRFYHLMSEANKTRSRSISVHGAAATSNVTTTPSENATTPRGLVNSDDCDDLGANVAASCHCHKALILACAIRALLKDDSFRSFPRAWAGYCCIGYGAFY